MSVKVADAKTWIKRLRAEGDASRAKHAQRFFRTGPGEYGEGDQFLGITVPRLRALAREALALSRSTLAELLVSPWHEIRLFSLIVLTEQAKRLPIDQECAALGAWVYARRKTINNWDLVDVSIPVLFGGWKPSPAWTRQMRGLLVSKSLWDRRMAMLATFGWLRQGDQKTVFAFARELFQDKQDLLHKASGWMLREAGKRNERALCAFLDEYASFMPRTMLRYALERLPLLQRKRYLRVKKSS